MSKGFKGFKGFDEKWLLQRKWDEDKADKHKHKRTDKKFQKPQTTDAGRQNVHRAESKKTDGGNDAETFTTVLVNIRVVDRRRIDADGILSTCMDTLVGAGLLKDDSTKYVQRIGIRLEYSERAGCDILIIEESSAPEVRPDSSAT